MTSRYIDSDGLSVTVSDEHLDIALEIFDELQKASPSNRCSWRQHKRLMLEAGFDDSDSNENYRQMIKQERKRRGVLPSVDKYADRVVTSKIEAIRKEIGLIRSERLETREVLAELNRLKRDWNKELLLIESLSDAFSKMEIKPLKVNNHQMEKSSRTLIVCLSDIHYGAVVDIEGNSFNKETCKKLFVDYLGKVIDIIKSNNVKVVHVVGLGDIIENVYMRQSQGFSVRQNFSQQVTEITELIYNFLLELSKYVTVFYSAINGNHDRISTKEDTLYGDGAVSISNHMIKMLIENTHNSNINFIDTEPYDYKLSVGKFNFLFVHGDLHSLKNNSLLAEQSQLYGVQFDALIAGHIHHFNMREVGDSKFVATFGSFKGNDEYALKKVGVKSSRSQGVILVKEDTFDIIRVPL